MKHKITKCIKVGVRYNISEWECPKCKLIFQCGDGDKENMTCEGIYDE